MDNIVPTYNEKDLKTIHDSQQAAKERTRQYAREYYARNRDRIRARVKERLETNPDLKEKNNQQAKTRFYRFQEKRKALIDKLIQEPTEEFKQILETEEQVVEALNRLQNILKDLKKTKNTVLTQVVQN
jgi:hypothetical protein